MIRDDRVSVVTVVTASHLPYARVLARSLHAFHPDIPVTIVVAERTHAVPECEETGVRVLPIERLGVPDLRRQAFVNDAHGLTVVAKPLALRYALDQGTPLAVFLDADVLVTGSLAPFFEACGRHEVSLTPHLLEPPAGTDRADRELTLLRSGTFNAGCVAASTGSGARQFLDWWSARLRTHPWDPPEAGVFRDQRWLDLAPALFDGVAVHRDPGCNVAYWNMIERRPRYVDGSLVVDGGPCRFFHFSGFDPARADLVSRYAASPAAVPVALSRLFDNYASDLRSAGWQPSTPAPYSYGTFDNDVAIPLVARRLYDDLGRATPLPDPFSTGPSSYYEWLTDVDDLIGTGHRVTRLWSAIYRQRPDLQVAFPDLTGRDEAAFVAWTATSGVAEHRIDPRLVAS